MSPHSSAAVEQQQFSPQEMMSQAESFALSKTSKSSRMTLGLAMAAGLFIGLAFVFYTTVTTGSVGMGWGPSHLLGGLAFSLGLVFIVVCGGELFTSTVLSLISLANREISTTTLLKTWAKVYVGNFLGASLLVALVMGAGIYQVDHGQWGLNALSIAQHKLHHSPLQAFSLGVLCNLLVCLAMWMTLSTRNIATKAMLVILPVALFVSTGFEHCVANMFMVPLGILIQQTAPAEFWHGIGVPAAQFADLTWRNFITHNLVLVTLGNIVGGGVLVGLGYRAIFRAPQAQAKRQPTLTPVLNTPIEYMEHVMQLENTLISEVMDTSVVSVQPETLVSTAVTQMTQAGVECAPVVNQHNELVGIFSTHDLLIDLWCRDYGNLDGVHVEALMKTDVQTVNPSDSLLHLAEYLCIDHEQLYPVSSAGIATSMTTKSLAERARDIQVNRPRQFPVVKDDKLLGMISRQHVVGALLSLLADTSVESETVPALQKTA